MPYKEIHVPAEILVDLGEGVIIYYSYNDGNADDPSHYWYTDNADSDETFDIRELPQYDKQKEKELTAPFANNIALYDEKMECLRTYHAEVIRQAYDNGDLLFEE